MANIHTETDQNAIHSESLELSKKAKGIIPFSEEEVVRFEAESKKYSEKLENFGFKNIYSKNLTFGICSIVIGSKSNSIKQ